MAKRLMFSTDARGKMAEGIQTLRNAVVITLGPKGRNVIIEQDFGTPLIVNDGVTIAKAVELEDRFENLGASVIIEAATKTNDTVGDGTTTAILLASELILRGMKQLDRGINPVMLRNGFDYYLPYILKAIDKQSIPVRSSEDLNRIATISSQDEEVGKLVSEAYMEVGSDGVITVEESQGIETYLDIVKGYSYDRGFLSPYMVNRQEKMTAELENPYILVIDKKITTMQELLPFLEETMKNGRPLLIVCDDIEQEVLGALVVNKMRGVFHVTVTKTPSFGDRKKRMLEDIAIVTGATLIDPSLGMELSSSSLSCLGSASKVIVSKDQTILVDGSGSSEEIINRVSGLKQELSYTSSEYDKEKLNERIAKLLGGVAIMKVGAATEPALKEKKLRIEDALCATRAAMQSGMVAGGGKVFYQFSKELPNIDAPVVYQPACEILVQTLQKPFYQILYNAGCDIDEILRKVTDDTWYDALEGKYVSPVEAGILDPASVAKSAITNAISVAGIFLTTECAIVSGPKNKTVNEEDLI